MDKIIMLGTGNGGTTNLYNTCFVIQNENGNVIVPDNLEIININ